MYLSEWYNDSKKIQNIFNNLPTNIETLSFVDSYGAMSPDMINFFLIRLREIIQNNIIMVVIFIIIVV